MAANGLFLLSQAQQMEMAKQDDPEVAAAAAALQVFTNPGASGGGPAPDPTWPGALPGQQGPNGDYASGEAPPSQQQQQQQQPNGKPAKGAARGVNKRKASAPNTKAGAKNPALPVAKRAKTTTNASTASSQQQPSAAERGAHVRRSSAGTSATANSDENEIDMKLGGGGGGGEGAGLGMPTEFGDFDDDDDDDEDGLDDGEGDKKKRGGRRGANKGGPVGDDEEKRKNFLERNRQAALKCRQRKKAWLASLQARVEYLTTDNEQLQTTVARQAQEIMYLKSALNKAQSVAVQHGIPATELQVPPINMNAILHQQHHQQAHLMPPLPPPPGSQGPPMIPPGVPMPSALHSQQQQQQAQSMAPNPMAAGSASVSPVNPTRGLPSAGVSTAVPIGVSLGGAAPGAYSAHAVPPRPGPNANADGNGNSHYSATSTGTANSSSTTGTVAAVADEPSRSGTPAHLQAVGPVA